MNRIPNGLGVLVVAGVCGAAAVGYRALESTPASRARADVRRVDGQLDEMRAELDELRRAISRSRADSERVVLMPAPAAPAGASETATVPEPPEDPEAREFMQQQRLQEAGRRLDAKLAAEPRDERWSQGMERDVRGSIAKSSPQSRVVSAECKTSFCKVVLAHQTSSDRDEMPAAIAQDLPFRPGVYYHAADHDDLMVTLYVVRESSAFADLGF